MGEKANRLTANQRGLPAQKEEEMKHEFSEWLDKVWPLVLNHTIEKAETILDMGEIKLYWAGTIVRIDIKPSID